MVEEAFAEIRSVAVVVPVRNEEATIGEMMRSVSRAAGEVGVEVLGVVVMDGCTDGTASEFERHRDASRSIRWQPVVGHFGRASSARQAGLEWLAAQRTTGEIESTVVMSTDADSVVPIDWIARHLTLLAGGCDGVAGVVGLLADARADEIRDRWARDYTALFRGDGHHPHVHAANLSVRLRPLLSVAGFGHAHRAEDIDLWRRLARTGARLRSDHSSVVLTSARSDGRVTDGFASALARLYPPEGTASHAELTP